MPLFDVFVTMFWFFLFFAWIYLLISVYADVFRSPDLSGWAKALWVVFMLALPMLGVLVYLVARGGAVQDRARGDMAYEQQMTQAYMRLR